MMMHHRRRDFLGGVKDNNNVFLKCHIGMANFLLENDHPKHNKNKKRRDKNVKKKSQNIPVHLSQVLQHISLSLYREREKKEAEVHALGSSYVISFSLVSPLLFLPFQSFLSFLSTTILLSRII